MASAADLLIRIMGDSSNAVSSFLGLRTESQSSMAAVTRAVQAATTQLSRNADGVRQALGTMFDDVTTDRLIRELQQGGEAGESAAREITQALNRTQSEVDRFNTDNMSDELNNVDDAVERNRRGLIIFGESWREVGQDARRSMDDTQDELRETETMLDKVKKSVAGLAAGLAGLEIAKSVDDGVSSAGHLRAMLGLTKEEAKEFNQVAREVYGDNFGGTMREASEAVALVSQSLNLTGEELKKQTENVLMLNDVFGELGADTQADLQAIRAMTTAWGISSQEALDIITNGFQGGAGGAGDLLETMTEYPKFFKDIGLTAQDMSKWLTEGMRAGAMDTDKLADSVHEMARIFKEEKDKARDALLQMFPAQEVEQLISNVAAGGPKGRDAFYAIAQGLASIEDPGKRAALAVELFGDVGGELSLNVLDPLLQKFVETKDKTIDLTGATDSMNEEYSGLAATIEGLKKKFETTMFGTVLEEVWPIIDGLGTLGLAMIGLGPIVLKVRGLFAAGTIATWGSTAAYWAAVLAVGALDLATAALGVTMAVLTSPITLITLALAGLSYLGYELYKNWDELEKLASEVWDSIAKYTGIAVDYMKEAWQGFSDFFTGMWDGLWSPVKGFLNLMIGGVNWVIDGLNKISIDIPSWVPKEFGGGNKWGIDISKIPMLAAGGEIISSGLAIVGEKGPELRYFNAGGAGVVSNKDTVDILKANSSSAIDYNRLGAAVASSLRGAKFVVTDLKNGVVDLVIDTLRQEVRI